MLSGKKTLKVVFYPSENSLGFFMISNLSLI